MLLISKCDTRHPGALCEVLSETPSAYNVRLVSEGRKPASVEGGILAGSIPWVVKTKGVETLNVTTQEYALYLANWRKPAPTS